jgi:hypothetical protein
MTARAHPAATAPLCRDLLPKGFKGKGEAIRWRNDLIVAVAQVHAAMTTLHQATTAVHSRFFYLERFRRNRTGALTLRWRKTTGRYVTWPMLQPSVRQLPQPLCEWYGEAQLRASWLNAQERAVRYALRISERLLHEMSPTLEGGNEVGDKTSQPGANERASNIVRRTP